MSPEPWKKLSELDAAAAAAVEQPAVTNWTPLDFGEEGPSDWVKPLVAVPDLHAWEERFLSGASNNGSDPDSNSTPDSDLDTDSKNDSDSDANAPAKNQLKCHGISGDYWVMSRDVAAYNLHEFSGQSEKLKTYNEDSVNEFEYSIRKLDDDT